MDFSFTSESWTLRTNIEIKMHFWESEIYPGLQDPCPIQTRRDKRINLLSSLLNLRSTRLRDHSLSLRIYPGKSCCRWWSVVNLSFSFRTPSTSSYLRLPTVETSSLTPLFFFFLINFLWLLMFLDIILCEVKAWTGWDKWMVLRLYPWDLRKCCDKSRKKGTREREISGVSMWKKFISKRCCGSEIYPYAWNIKGKR